MEEESVEWHREHHLWERLSHSTSTVNSTLTLKYLKEHSLSQQDTRNTLVPRNSLISCDPLVTLLVQQLVYYVMMKE